MNILMAILVVVNGQVLNFNDTQPIKDGGYVLIPLRGVFERIGARVHYAPATRAVEITQGNRRIETAVGRNHAWINGNEVSLDMPVRLQNGRVLVPVRFVAEALGADVTWNRLKNAVFIETQKTTVNLPEPATPSIRAGEIEVIASTNKSTYRTGEMVQFQIVVQNQDEHERKLTFSSGQTFDITVQPAEGKAAPRWTWSHGRMFTQALREVTLQPGGRLTFSATWNQHDDQGTPMPRGEYLAHTSLIFPDGGIIAPPVPITLVE